MKPLRPLVLALALLAAAPVLAQTPLGGLDEHSARRLDRMEKALKEIRAIVFQGRETGQPVVVEPADTDAQLGAINDKLNDLQKALTRINDQLDVTGHALDQAQHEADSLREENGALKDRLTRLEQKVDALGAAAAPAANAAPDGIPQSSGDAAAPDEAPNAAAAAPDPASTFDAARRAFDARDFAGAANGFRDYVERFGDTPRAPLARYFLGRALMERQDYAGAAAAEVAAIRLWPQTSWAPDAVLELSRSLIALGKPGDACQTLAELQRRYPRAAPAVRAHAAAARREARCD
ncbi:MAG TPA: tetratricopeptide repeat protein [Caulobacteraceae bacterium]|nr:tetratricopeptide repeat protein [Caulobacteraceae bacterium]